MACWAAPSGRMPETFDKTPEAKRAATRPAISLPVADAAIRMGAGLAAPSPCRASTSGVSRRDS